MCTVLLPPGDNPIAVYKYINKYYYDGRIQDEMVVGGTYDKYYEKINAHGILAGNENEISLTEDLGIDGTIILKCILKKNDRPNWIHLTKDR
jgi:hypothetical protein